MKSGKLVPEPPTKDTGAIGPTPHGGVSGRIGMGRKRSPGERDAVQMHAPPSTSEGKIRAPRSLADFGAILGVPRACLKKKQGNPASQMPFSQLQKGLGDRDRVQARR